MGAGRQLGLGLAVVLGLGFTFTPWGQFTELVLEDSLFLLRGARPTPPDPVIVAVDEPSMAELGLPWPWPRRIHARLLDRLYAAGAREVILDILFAEASDPEDDRLLAEALARHPRTLLAADVRAVPTAGGTQLMAVGPWDVFPGVSLHTGLIGLPLDPDGVVRRIRLHPQGGPALVLAAAGPAVEAPDDALRIDFLGPAGTLRRVSYYQALDPEGHLPPGLFAGRRVLVGAMSPDLGAPGRAAPDHFSVPWSRWGGGRMAGVEIQGQALHNLLHGGGLRQPPLEWLLPLAWVWAWGLGLAFLRLPPGPGLGLWLGSTAFTVGGIYAAFAGASLVLPPLLLLLPPGLAWIYGLGWHYAEERRQKTVLRRAFGNYLAPALVNRLLDDPGALHPGGRRVEATVMFLDLAGFTSLAEDMSPETLVTFMNRVMGQVVEVVMGEQGMIDKFIGDAVMAVWGAVLAQPDHALRACRAAWEIQRRMDGLAQAFAAEGGPFLSARIGINSGAMVAGNLGGERRFDFTVMGNAVNLASRLEGVNKVYATRILLGEDCARRVEGQVALRFIDRVRVKGKQRAVAIYELRGPAVRDDPLDAAFARALARYRRRDWQGAEAAFVRCLEIAPEDGPSRALLARCRAFQRHPPPPDWDGSFGMTGK